MEEDKNQYIPKINHTKMKDDYTNQGKFHERLYKIKEEKIKDENNEISQFKVSNNKTNKILSKLQDSDSILGKPFHERQQLYQMQIKNKNDELEYKIYKNQKIDKESGQKLSEKEEIHYANKGTEKILQKLKDKNH